MKYEYIDIKELRAIYLTAPVTLAYCEIPEGGHTWELKEIDDFMQAAGWVPNVTILCNSIDPTLQGFYELDERMKDFVGIELIVVEDFQCVISDPYDQDELHAFIKIAEGWAEDTGAKIVLLLVKEKEEIE